MTNQNKINQHAAEMAQHAEGAAKYLASIFAGQYVTPEQTRETIDFLTAKMKRDIESCQYATNEEKEFEIRRRETMINAMKVYMGLL